jgi:squalene synthase HpnC
MNAVPASSMRSDLILPPEILAPLNRSWTEDEAFAFCTALTRSHYENFPVGSVLAPKKIQPAIHSLYAFMRTADDFSDENRRPGDGAERTAWLASWGQLLSECEQGRPRHPIFIALKVTLDHYRLPTAWLRDLLTAFTMDCTINRYRTYEDVLTYCRYSANPVGRLILTLFGYRSEELYRLSDSICTGLQLANHWQDVAVDLKKDRIYLPQEDLERFGVQEKWLMDPLKPHPQPLSRWERGEKNPLPSGEGGRRPGEAPFKDLMKFEVDRTRHIFEHGRALPEQVHGRLRWELRLTWKGGVTILDKIEAAGYDVFRRRPVVTKLDWARLALSTVIPRGRL